MRDVFQALSEPARTLRLVNSFERQIEDLKAYEQRSRSSLALVTVLVAALFDRRVDERGVVIFVAFLLVAAGLLPYLAVRSRRRALERRRDRRLNSAYDAYKLSLRSEGSSKQQPEAPAGHHHVIVVGSGIPASESRLWLWRKVPADS